MSAIMNGLVVGGVLVAIVIAVAIVMFQRHLGKHRGVSREDFIGAFANTAIPAQIPGTVYDFYKSRVLAKGFGVAPSDDFDNVLYEGEEEIDADARLLMKKLSFNLPPEEVRRRWTEQILTSRDRPLLTLPTDPTRRMQPIQTLRDMVLWLDWVRQHQQPIERSRITSK